VAVQKKSRQLRLINKFIKIFFLTFAILIVVAALGTIGYVQVASSNIMKSLSNNPVTSRAEGESIDSVLGKDEASFLNSKKITTVAIFGVDVDGYRTDVNMLAFFHHESGEIDIVSIPRDTKVKIPDEIFKEINATRSGVKQNDRINSIPAYVSSDRRNEVSVAVLESVFGVDVDYFVNLNLDGFKDIVDAVGPIPVEVPMDMEYTDLAQDPPLVINLKAGYRELNGAQAEQLIRFRYGYSNADIGRISTQHEFMKSFLKKVLEPEKRINMISILETVLVDVTTDFNDAVDYLIYLDDLSADKVNMTTLPGGPSPHDGTYTYDVELTKELFESIINKKQLTSILNDSSVSSSNESGGKTEINSDSGGNATVVDPIIEVEPLEPLDVTDFTISVKNGTNVSGLASRTRDRLIEAGLDVQDIGNYDNRPIERTIIKVPDREIGDILDSYFNNPQVFVDEKLMDAEIQVIIAVGTNDSE
jgi:LCP family protein required for cell wall assembly